MQTYKKINICRPNCVALCDMTKQEVKNTALYARSTVKVTFFTALLFFSGGWAARLQRFTCCGDDLSSWLSTHVSSGHWRALSGSLTRKQGKPAAYTQDAQPCKLNMHLSKKVPIKIPNRGREVHSRMYAEKMYSYSARRRFSATREAKYLARENVWPLSFFFLNTSCSLFLFCFLCLARCGSWEYRARCRIQEIQIQVEGATYNIQLIIL